MTSIDPKRWLTALAETFELERERLGRLDADVGDGDHGASMARGFSRAREVVAGSDDAPGALLGAAGRAFMSGVGGASGPLFATLLLELGKSAEQAGALDLAAMEHGMRQTVQRVERLGRSNVGDKTMLDALAPAADALEAAAERGASLAEATARAAEAAEEGAKRTIALAARQGRARFIEGQGVGRADPGAVSTALIFRVLSDVAKESMP